MNLITKELKKTENFISYIKELENNTSPISLSGLTDVAKIALTSSVKEHTKRPICYVTYNEIQARKILEDMKNFNKKIIYFPKKEILTYDYIAESKELPYQRIEALNKIYYKDVDIIITTIEALTQKIVPKDVIYSSILNFKFGEKYDLDEVKQKLVHLGYERYDLIEARGQFSVRGGILDISLSEKIGVRIEFWGNEVDSIRYFDISNQRSTKMIKTIKILPSHEYVLENDVDIVCNKILKRNYSDSQIQNVKEDVELIKSGNYISKVDKYFNSFYTKSNILTDYLSKDFLIILDEKAKIDERLNSLLKDNENVIKALIEKQRIVPDIINIQNTSKEIEEVIKNRQVIYLEKQDFNFKTKSSKYLFNYREVNFYRNNLEGFLSELKIAKEKKKKTIIVSQTEEKIKKISELLTEKGFKNRYIENNENFENSEIIIVKGKLSGGFEEYDLNLLVIDANELIAGEKKKRRITNKNFKDGEKIVFADLKIGDFVVHKTHGIGQFIGINTITADKITKDYIKIKYKGEDILYIPTNQLDSMRKYIGGGQRSPKVNRLGSKEWDNTKTKVKNNLREVAKELIELYAKRKKVKGFAFSKDTPWQRQFEDSFEYIETDDQLRCINEVKKDMEADKPMDRLLCGDVGYGKTEVAIRAAFKSVMDQKQVCYLVPTTILSDQQYQSFKDRMKDFPIRVEVLNRFRTKKEQEDIIKRLKLGEIDIIIGTHRMLSKDVSFKSLGLLIIDEEHRFGVKDKEKIKEYKNNVDVLTMTATPIPRTLHMSIVGVRDMSVIYDPPQNRKPVQTYVLEYDQEVIKEAIIKELERKGQIFYLFNNVGKIIEKAEEISKLVPEARVGYAHGKMTGRELESIMIDYIKGDIDVLVCTTILESGIDIPNANTIIVENSDRLGLAQLYQIRGRVGRSDKQAYSYITYKRDKLLSEVADKRLKAMKEFTEFGSGFKIAMRDLEIRGAGSLLGDIQHGHLEQVGYDTYCNLLDEVLKEMQGIKLKEDIEVQIDLNISSYIPDEYISEYDQKIEIYQNIALCKTEEDIQNVIDEIIDRYGQMPEEIENLIKIAQIKQLCKNVYINKIMQKIGVVLFYFDNINFDMEIVDKLLKIYRNKIKFSPSSIPYITLKVDSLSDDKILKDILSFIKNIQK